MATHEIHAQVTGDSTAIRPTTSLPILRDQAKASLLRALKRAADLHDAEAVARFADALRHVD